MTINLGSLQVAVVGVFPHVSSGR